MKVKFIIDTNAEEFEKKINEELENIEPDYGIVKSINATVSHPERMRDGKIVGVGNLFSALIAYEE